MRKYSQAYIKIIKDSKDIQGIVAYSIYKQQKIEWIEEFVAKNSRKPDEKELDAFHQNVLMDTAINNYKASADKLLQKYGEIVFRKKIEQISSIDEQLKGRKQYWAGFFGLDW